MNYCHALLQDGNAVWPNATAGTTVQGTCIVANGFTGIAIRTCSSSAVWGVITTPCVAIQAPCPAVLDYQGRTNWPSTTAGATATGTCALGYTTGPNGAPTRVCLGLGTGTWSTTVTNDCAVGMRRLEFGKGGAWRPGNRSAHYHNLEALLPPSMRRHSHWRQRQQPYHVRHDWCHYGQLDHPAGDRPVVRLALSGLLHQQRQPVPAGPAADWSR